MEWLKCHHLEKSRLIEVTTSEKTFEYHAPDQRNKIARRLEERQDGFYNSNDKKSFLETVNSFT